ncbi:hypothetical protein H4R19_000731 [Coemansia spiralis]|nr:hypothetical protein H4R19_000731 [Coemansia spiralis]
MIESIDAIPLELITYTGLTHLQLKGSTSADDMMDFIHRQRHLVSLHVDCLTPFDTQTDFSITECAEHEPMALLDTQIKRLNICQRVQEGPFEPAHSILKYLLLRIPTLKTVTAPAGLTEQLQAFIDEYVQWYPHLANVKLV